MTANLAMANAEQYVSFTLAGERYAAEISRVQEIKGFDSVTRVPNTPAYLLGVVNLRGAIVPIIDLRARFDLQCVPYDATTVILVVRVPHAGGERTAGVVVDSVDDVQTFSSDCIRPPPPLGMADQSFIRGIANLQGKTLMLIDIDTLINTSVEAA